MRTDPSNLVQLDVINPHGSVLTVRGDPNFDRWTPFVLFLIVLPTGTVDHSEILFDRQVRPDLESSVHEVVGDQAHVVDRAWTVFLLALILGRKELLMDNIQQEREREASVGRTMRNKVSRSHSMGIFLTSQLLIHLASIANHVSPGIGRVWCSVLSFRTSALMS